MKISLKYRPLLFALAKTLLFGRRLAENIRLAFWPQTDIGRSGFAHFKKESFLQSRPSADLDETDLIRLLDTFENASVASQGPFSVEHINQDDFYQARLGPRLRLTYRINDFENWPPLAQALMRSNTYREVLQSFAQTQQGVFKCYIEKTFVGGEEPDWHVDSNSKIGRLIYFLNDVESDDGPLEYLEATHLDSAANYVFMKHRQLLQAESWTPYKTLQSSTPCRLTGKKGESYFFDSRGVHRASLSRHRSRYVMMISFTPQSWVNRLLDLPRGGWPQGTRNLKSF